MGVYQEADKAFYVKHPELNGRKLTNASTDKHYKDEYVKMLDEQKKSTAVPAKKAADPVLPCQANKPPASGNSGTSNPQKPCKAKKMKVEVGGNSYVLSIPGTNLIHQKKNYNNLSVYEVVAGGLGYEETITLNAEGIEGPCPDLHQNTTFNYSETEIRPESKTDSKMSLKLSSRTFEEKKSFKAFCELVGYLFSKKYLSYQIDFETCNFSSPVSLHVYPKLEATAKFELEYEKEWGKQEEDDDDDEKEESFLDNLKFELEAKHAGSTLVKMGYEKSEEATPFTDFLKIFHENMRYVNKGFGIFLNDSDTIKVSFKPSLSGSCEVKYVENKPFIGVEYSIKLGFDPLISLEGEADVSNKLLQTIPGIGTFLSASIHAAERAGVGEIFLGFNVCGELGINADIVKEAGGDLQKPELKVSGSVKITLKGKVKSEAKIWYIKYNVGAEVGATSGFEVDESKLEEDDKGIFFNLTCKFLGITLFYQVWYELGVSAKSTAVPDAVAQKSLLQSGNIDTKVGGVSEKDDVVDMSDNNKYTLVEEREIYSGKLYVLGG